MKSRLLPFVLGAPLMFAGVGSALAAGSSMQNQGNHKTETIKYFLGHSLGFAPIFNLYHHSPGWILRRRTQLKLTTVQIAEEKTFTLGMQKQTGIDITALRKAYGIYTSDAARREPALALIKRDVNRIGQDEATLGFEMVPYHLKAYEVLTPAQKTVYAKLEAAFLKSLSLSMYANTSFNASQSPSSH